MSVNRPILEGRNKLRSMIIKFAEIHWLCALLVAVMYTVIKFVIKHRRVLFTVVVAFLPFIVVMFLEQQFDPQFLSEFWILVSSVWMFSYSAVTYRVLKKLDLGDVEQVKEAEGWISATFVYGLITGFSMRTVESAALYVFIPYVFGSFVILCTLQLIFLKKSFGELGRKLAMIISVSACAILVIALVLYILYQWFFT